MHEIWKMEKQKKGGGRGMEEEREEGRLGATWRYKGANKEQDEDGGKGGTMEKGGGRMEGVQRKKEKMNSRRKRKNRKRKK